MEGQKEKARPETAPARFPSSSAFPVAPIRLLQIPPLVTYVTSSPGTKSPSRRIKSYCGLFWSFFNLFRPFLYLSLFVAFLASLYTSALDVAPLLVYLFSKCLSYAVLSTDNLQTATSSIVRLSLPTHYYARIKPFSFFLFFSTRIPRDIM